MKKLLALVFLWPRVAYSEPSVVSIGINVSDAPKLAQFYENVLSFENESTETLNHPQRDVRHLRLGEERFDLTEFKEQKGKAVPKNLPSNNTAFEHIAIVVSDMNKAYAAVRGQVEHVSPEPQTIPQSNPAAGGIKAFYFKDPDGHNLELIWFPKEKGDPRWQNKNGRLFLGIDHTAIAVTDTDKSLPFYTNKLGLHVAGTSDNFGIEQERLSDVPGAHVRITGLRGNGGPGIEFLDYISPLEQRAGTVSSNDILYWEIILSDSKALRSETIQDPDGHTLRLVN